MSNADRFQLNGIVTETLKGGQFKVRLENGIECIGTLGGKLRINSIKIIPGDEVLIDMSPYDTT